MRGYNHMQMSLPVRFPAVYERVSPFRTVEQIETEMNRRCGYPPENVAPPVREVDPIEARAGTAWEQRAALNANRALAIANRVTRGTRKKNAGQLNRPLISK